MMQDPSGNESMRPHRGPGRRGRRWRGWMGAVLACVIVVAAGVAGVASAGSHSGGGETLRAVARYARRRRRAW
ncbi:hypothetical protein [uncultured Bifidobacterium sp.]|uniref:hypothetical protein n=1 Tax=uncultured Bifidobacterium sp. TaxID=165187 RepID=UPI00261C7677|nr:hypothetical protein [uncultured Bifidobacterium sp.]